MIKNIVIVGGGAAGWLTAGIIAADYAKTESKYIRVTLVESPDISTIGVGEGTWPTMRTTLRRIGLSETDFIRFCNASFKQGSKFVGWKSGEVGDNYYHPFTIPLGYSDADFHEIWQQSYSELSYDRTANIQADVSDSSLAPKTIAMPEFGGALNYGYHLDAGKFGELLKEHCTRKLGVTYVSDNVVDVNTADSGLILSVQTKVNGNLSGDLFIDCSGTHCLLLGKHYKVGFKDCSRYSANDAALAIQVPYPEENFPIASATIATAQSSGWTWDIGLSSRRGVGYVYSSAHISDDAAEQELRQYVSKSVGEDVAGSLSARKIPIRAGHREKFWHKNCVAIGMAAGFIEPLEASALALVELSASYIRDELPMNLESLPIVEKRFNRLFSYRWQKIIDFLKLHYVISGRRDTEYWQDMTRTESIPDSLQELLELWKCRAPIDNDFEQSLEVFPSASYQYVLYGMGYPTQTGFKKVEENQRRNIVRAIQNDLSERHRFMKGLPTNRDLLNKLKQHAFQKI